MRLAACTAKRGGAAAAAELGSGAAIGRNNKDSLFTVASSSFTATAVDRLEFALELRSGAAIGRNKDSLFTVASSSTAVVGVKLGPAPSAVTRVERRLEPEPGPEAGRRPTHTATKPAKVEHKSGRGN